ncbi:hypothetical protein [Gordonia sp. NB41Y]|uniref:hypothetical protein n=1 Tax=Gordonia sp. NB41Y TaxID=875808 RepID=UPI0006B1AE5C|nr:hypothetical protein [Gordonia sp. NB41Y]KOY49131.1 hypothetical protein ISGA_12225 [Gordonia sp. NB41Y]WLP89114.1 hypothetical protein Q9K23_16075 [Gordonia sp. NB41Y]
MSRIATSAVDPAAVTVTTTQVEPAPCIPGIDPLDINNLDEAQVFAYLHEINSHITRRMIRDAVLRKELRGVRRGNKGLFSRRAALAWMTGEDA